MPRTHYSDVTPGTKSHAVLHLMLRPEGCTAKEASAVSGWRVVNIKVLFGRFMDMNGYDICSYDLPPTGRGGPCEKVFYIAGRWTWDGEYDAYINPKLTEIAGRET